MLRSKLVMTKVKVINFQEIHYLKNVMQNTETLSYVSLAQKIKDRVSFMPIPLKYWLLLAFALPAHLCIAQMNLSGKSGLMYIPNATEYKDGSLSFGYNYNPKMYALRGKQKNHERVLYANLTLLPRLTITLNITQTIATDKQIREGLGDRQIDISYLILKEKPKVPSLAIIMSSPFMIETVMLTNVLVATKHFDLKSNFNLETNLGYGSPYVLSRKGGFQLNLNNANIFSNLQLIKKSEFQYNNGYLVGPFAGVKLSYHNKVGLMTEWDSQHLNVGAYVTLWKKWIIQGGLLNGDQFMFGSSFHLQLLKPKKSIDKLDEKNY